MHLSVTAFRQWLSLPSNDHIIHFYPSDEALISNLCEYVSTGLEKGDATIVITKPIHIKKLCEAVCEHRTGSRELFRNHSVVLNATAILDDIIVDGLPDWGRFFSTVGSVIGQAVKNNKTIRVYGECMSILWQAGNKDAAIQLEKYWNKLAKIYPFSLYCTYPEQLFMKNNSEQVGLNSCHALITAPQMA